MSKNNLARASFYAPARALFDDPPPAEEPRERRESVTALREKRKVKDSTQRSSWRLRLGALSALSALLVLLACVARGAYHAWADSVVAPLILAPDSELVTSSKLSLNKLLSERDSILRRLGDNKELAQAAAHSAEQLRRLKATADQALKWSDAISVRLLSSSTSDLNVLTQQRQVLDKALASKQAFLVELRQNVASGLMSKTELAKEEVALRELEHLALQNERERLQTGAKLAESRLTQQALHGNRPLITPDMIEQQKALVHIDLELVQLEAEQRARTQAIGSDEEELSRIQSLVEELRAKPSFQAIESKQELAFVPYTQLPGVTAGANVYRCDLFSVFACERVGTILKVFPGEAVNADPWGTPTRGRYAAMHLDQPSAATARSLRVRGSGGQREDLVVPTVENAPEARGEQHGSTALEDQRAER